MPTNDERALRTAREIHWAGRLESHACDAACSDGMYHMSQVIARHYADLQQEREESKGHCCQQDGGLKLEILCTDCNAVMDVWAMHATAEGDVGGGSILSEHGDLPEMEAVVEAARRETQKHMCDPSDVMLSCRLCVALANLDAKRRTKE